MDPGPSQGSGQLSDIIQLSSETQCRSRSLRTETNIQQDVKCELKVKPCECVWKEFLSTTVKTIF